MSDRQELIDRFYWEFGPCCAGCDWWQHMNSSVGECTRSAPVASGDRIAMLGTEGASIDPGAGHIMTPRDHRCGEFRDTFDWSTLPLPYRKRVGVAAAQEGEKPNG